MENGGMEMKKLMLIFAWFAVAGLAGAQETRTELVRPTTPADDSKPNSDSVPPAYAIGGQFERVVVLRLKYQADLLTGLESMVKKERICNAVILSGIGSVRGYQYHVVSNRTFPSKDVYVKNPTAPADLVSMNGYVVNGRVHAHMTLANPDKAFGGHLEPGTEVFTFAIVTIGVLNDNTDLSRVDDKSYR
jgi:predicted DNA-binding protein with PD1-like motif